MDAIELLLSDHRKVDSIFQQFEKGGNSDEFTRLFAQLKDELSVHTQIEEEIFYPAARNNPDTANLVAEAYQEQAEVKNLLSQVESMDNTTTEWGQRMTEIMRDVQAHVQMEETEMFPKVRQAFDTATLEQLGQQLEQRKAELKGQVGATEAPATRPNYTDQPVYTPQPDFTAPRDTAGAFQDQYGTTESNRDMDQYGADNDRDLNQRPVNNNRDLDQPSM